MILSVDNMVTTIKAPKEHTQRKIKGIILNAS